MHSAVVHAVPCCARTELTPHVTPCWDYYSVGIRRPARHTALRTSGVHMWETAAPQDGARFCSMCERLCFGFGDAPVQCCMCGMLAHDSCTRHAANNCKPLHAPPPKPDVATAPGVDATASKPAKGAGAGAGAKAGGASSGAADAPQKHEHHWVRGNLPPTTTCCVCEHVCASAFELKGVQCQWCVGLLQLLTPYAWWFVLTVVAGATPVLGVGEPPTSAVWSQCLPRATLAT